MRQDTREQIFEFLQDYQRQNGFAPTVREICAGVGLRSPSTVHYHLNALRQAGRIGGQTSAPRHHIAHSAVRAGAGGGHGHGGPTHSGCGAD